MGPEALNSQARVGGWNSVSWPLDSTFFGCRIVISMGLRLFRLDNIHGGCDSSFIFLSLLPPFFSFGFFSTEESKDFFPHIYVYTYLHTVRCEPPCLGAVTLSAKALGSLTSWPMSPVSSKCYVLKFSLLLVRLGGRSPEQEWEGGSGVREGMRKDSRTLWRLKSSSCGYRLRGRICDDEDKNRQRREVKYRF